MPAKIPKSKLTPNEKSLIRRYLVWAYKTTKEELDHIDRKFTQLTVDYFLLGEFERAKRGAGAPDIAKHLEDFRAYIAQKEQSAAAEKYTDAKKDVLRPQYSYLKGRLTNLEKAIRHFLGVSEVRKIKQMYEDEMTQRILQAREHT